MQRKGTVTNAINAVMPLQLLFLLLFLLPCTSTVTSTEALHLFNNSSITKNDNSNNNNDNLIDFGGRKCLGSPYLLISYHGGRTKKCRAHLKPCINQVCACMHVWMDVYV